MVRSHLIPLIIAGPTASGKSALALKLALRHNGEIICADSRQFYANMNIGAAGPSPHELEAVPHHGYGMLDLNTHKIDAGFFVDFALKTIADIQSRNRRPILVGGGGLYLRSLRYGLLDVPPSNPDVACMLEKRCDEIGLLRMHDELFKIDPACAKGIHQQDRYRIVRALEIFYVSGSKPSSVRQSFKIAKPKLLAHWVLKRPHRELLLKRIESRVIEMFDQGLLKEAIALRELVPRDHWCLNVMGYREALMLADRQISKEMAIEQTIIRHRQYAKRQYTWFNKEPFYRLVIQ
jgi:tRNA dimethylallyltransferase